MTATMSEMTVLNSKELLAHWQGQRRLTRRVIEVFPNEKLFSFSVGSMRPFSEMAKECATVAESNVHGVATGKWVKKEPGSPETKEALLKLWDDTTTAIDSLWETIPPHRFTEVDSAYGMWTVSGIAAILYAIDNEVHHRGQAYVYLRELGVEPPPFWERG
jgi:uncharacterized damage-inducible protein DinB